MEDGHPDLAIAGVSLDCADPDELADFYGRLLQGTVAWRTPTAAGVKAAGWWLVAQRVESYRPPQWPGTSIVHLDLSSEDFDLAEQRAFALECGAVLAPVQPDPRWAVMLDPAGHPFCLTPITPE